MRIYGLIPAILSVSLLFCVSEASASQISKKKKKKKQTTEAAAPKPAPKKEAHPYDKFMKDVVDSAKGGFINLYRNKKDKVFVEFPKNKMGRRVLVGSTISSTSDPNFMDVGYKYNQPLCLQVEMIDSTVVLYESAAGASTKDSLMKLAMDKSYVPKLYSRIPINAYKKDSSSVIFEITSLLNAMVPKGNEFSVVKSADSKSSYFGKMKSFSDNASIVMHNNIEFSRQVFIAKIKIGEGSISSNVSIMLLPEKEMRPRIQDSRIGIFSTSGINRKARVDLSNAEDGLKTYKIANRWKIEPSDIEAWKKGETVAVKNPIVWYVDNTFPQAWRKPIKEGVLAWNAAFENFGLKDALVVKDFPTAEEEPEFDPDNLKYSCIRYVPNATMNAYGPSWVDPLSGEILNASVIVYNDIIRLINNWRFVQTAQVDERVRAKKMPDDVMDESITYVISHEIGHTLGLMHNMGASASFPVESLRDPGFTAKYGVTPSIMDYARFNYVAQPEDKNVTLVPPSIGVYDAYAIEWLYKPVPQAEDMWEEAEIAGRIIEEKEGQAFYRYGAQQMSAGAYASYDPSALAEDLGDDPLKAGAYGIKNLKYILPNVNNWIEDDEDFSHRSKLFMQIAGQYNRYLNNALAQVGGIYLNHVKTNSTLKPAIPVSKQVQRNSLRWVLNELKNSSWVDEKSLTENSGLHVPYSNKIANIIGARLVLEVPSRVVLSAAIAEKGKAYTLKDYYDDLYNEIFLPSSKLNSIDKTLQTSLIDRLSKSFGTTVKGKSLLGVSEEEENFLEKSHICLGEASEPYQRAVDVSSISEIASYSGQLLTKVRSLVSARRQSASPEDRAHYEYLYIVINNALSNK